MTNIKLKKYKLKYNDIMKKTMYLPDYKFYMGLALSLFLFFCGMMKCEAQTKQPYKQIAPIQLDTIFDPKLEEDQEFIMNIKMYKEGDKLHIKDHFNVEFDRQWTIEMVVGYLEQVYLKLEKEKKEREQKKTKTEKLNP